MVYGVKKVRKWTTVKGEVKQASYPKGDTYYLYEARRVEGRVESKYLGVGDLPKQKKVQ